jgi:hypothetical protein
MAAIDLIDIFDFLPGGANSVHLGAEVFSVFLVRLRLLLKRSTNLNLLTSRMQHCSLRGECSLSEHSLTLSDTNTFRPETRPR